MDAQITKGPAMNDTKAELNRLISEAFTQLNARGSQSVTAVMLVLDPVWFSWEPYATGTAEWFAKIIDEDSIVEIYQGARLLGHYGTVLVELRW